MYVCGLDHAELGEKFFSLTDFPLCVRAGAHRIDDIHHRIMGIVERLERPVKKPRILVQTTVAFGFCINIGSQ